MQNNRQVFWGIITALVALLLTLGVLLLSVSEGNQPVPTSTLPPTSTPRSTTPTVWQSSTPLIHTATALLILQSPTPLLATITPSLTPSQTPSVTACPVPQGWLPYIVRAGDTLNALALRYTQTSTEIGTANCLGTNPLLPGQSIYLPALPTRTPVPCGAPKSWVIYIVQQGDTLYHLSKAYGVTVAELQKANCLTGSRIQLGQTLFVPPWSPIFPTPTCSPVLETPTTTDLPTDVSSTPAP